MSLYIFLFSSFPNVLCDTTNLIWREGAPFEAMTDRTAPSSDGLLAEVFRGFPQLQDKCQEICAQPPGLIFKILERRREGKNVWTE